MSNNMLNPNRALHRFLLDAVENNKKVKISANGENHDVKFYQVSFDHISGVLELGEVCACTDELTTFKIESGDYIDSREFTREECERFCEWAVECGFGRGTNIGRLTNSSWWALGVHETGCHLFGYVGESKSLTNNITIQFREFLDKEKGMGAVNNIKAASLIGEQLRKQPVIRISVDGVEFIALANSYSIEDDGISKRLVIDSLSVDITPPKPEAKEMTVADIEKALGYSVKVVK